MNDRRSGAAPYADLSRRTSGGGGRSRNGLIIGAIALGLVVILAVVAVVFTGGDDNPDAVQEAGPVEVTGAPLPPFPEVNGFVAPPESDPAVGQTPPTLKGEDFQGEPVTIDPGDGRAKVVAFVAHWCPHCQAEVPLIQRWVDDGNLPEDVDLFAVSTGVRNGAEKYPPSKWLADEGWSEGVLLDNADQSAATSWALPGYPYLVFVDAEGNVAARASGQLPEADLDALVQQIAAS